MAILASLGEPAPEPPATATLADASAQADLPTPALVDPDATLNAGASSDLASLPMGAVSDPSSPPATAASVASTLLTTPLNAPLAPQLAAPANVPIAAPVAAAFSSVATAASNAADGRLQASRSDVVEASPLGPRSKAGPSTSAKPQSNTTNTALQATTDPEAHASRRALDPQWFAAMQAQRSPQVQPESPVPLPSLVGPEKGTSERFIASKVSTEAAVLPATFEASPMSQNSAAVGEATTLAPAQPETVKYWMSQDVQNAELQVDGLGDGPVEVRISLQGNEAHVAFHTDELGTQSLLQGAGADLKESLQREGVVLLGVSVGTSGSQDGQGGERKPRQNVKIGQVVAAQSSPIQAAGRTTSGVPGSVDLFV
jgi:flagellar hook-length control protein FliK